MPTFTEKMKALLYGPGWMPGDKHRLGDMSSMPDKTPPRTKYDPRVSFLTEAYIFVNFFINAFFYQELARQYQV